MGRWSRVGLIVDSELEDVKYVLEVGETGFKSYEFLSRMFYYKKNDAAVGVMFY